MKMYKPGLRLPRLLIGSMNWSRVAAGLFALALISTFAVALSNGTARADISVATDDFEDYSDGPTGQGWLDEWDFDDGARYTSFGDPHGGSGHIRLRGRGSSAVRSAEVTGESALRLKVWLHADDLNSGQHAVLEVSANGSSFAELERLDRGDIDNYTFFDLDLSTTGLTFDSQIWVRIRITDGDGSDGEFYMDNLEILNSGDNPDTEPSQSGSQIVIDSNFDDWAGKPMISDPYNDESGGDWNDVAAVYWTNNIDEGVNYHMIERHTTNGQAYNGNNGQVFWARYILYIDTNNNGNYNDSSDRRAVVTYVPWGNSGQTNVKLYRPNSSHKIYDSGWKDWGQKRSEGGLKVEFALDWDDLGIEFGGVIRMYAVSFSGLSSNPNITDRAPNGSADIQWSPASVLGIWVLAAAGAGGAVFIWYLSRRRKLWT